MNGEYQDKGWVTVDRYTIKENGSYIQTLAMQQGVGVFFLVIHGKDGGGVGVGDPEFVRGAMLEAVEPSDDGEVDLDGLVRIVPPHADSD